MGWPVCLGGIWYGRYRDPRDGNKIKSTRIKRHTSEEAREDANECERQLKLPSTEFDPTWTLAKYIEWWLARERKMQSVKPQTLYTTETSFNTHVLAYEIAKKTITSITKQDITDWFLKVKTKNQGVLSAQITARKAMSTIITSAVGSGHAWGIREGFPRKDTGMRIAKSQKVERRTLSATEYETLQDSPKPRAHDLFIRGFVNTGCRPEEMHALRPKHFDFESETVTICETAVWLSRKRDGGGDRLLILPETKTYLARTIAIDPEYMADLKAFIEEENIGRDHIIFSHTRMGFQHRGNRKELIDLTPELLETLGGFTIGNRNFKHGTYYAYSTGNCHCKYCNASRLQRDRRLSEARVGKAGTLQRGPERDVISKGVWCQAVREHLQMAGVDWNDFKPYDFRHTHATWLAERGLDAIELRNRMGHLRMETTMGYIHKAEINRKAVELLSRITAPVPQAPAQPSTDLTSLLAGVSATELFALLQTKMAQEQKMAQSG